MIASLDVITAPAALPVTPDELKSWLGITQTVTTHDVEIDACLIAARDWVERAGKLTLIKTVRRMTLDGFPEATSTNERGIIEFKRSPLIAVDSIKYVDSAGVQQTLEASKYQVDARSDPGRVAPAWGESWPSTRDQLATVELQYQCGFGTGRDDIPGTLLSLVRFIASHWFSNRETVSVGTGTKEIEWHTRRVLMLERNFEF
jgi:uncharacterized phiE125 gp8 family phage protein